MNLTDERNTWRECYKKGDQPYLIQAYKEHRTDELWRYSKQVEQALEYALYLESLLEEKAA